jgi:hypothetical protein
MADSIEEKIKKNVELERSLGNQVTLLEEKQRIIDAQRESLDKQVEMMGRLDGLSQSQLAAAADALQLEAERSDLSADRREALEAEAALARQLSELDDDAVSSLKDKIREQRRFNALQSQAVGDAEKFADNAAHTLNNMLGIGNAWKSSGLVGGFMAASREAGGMTGALGGVVEKFAGVNIGANLAFTAVTKIADATFNLAIAQDQSIAQFRTMTGLGKEYDSVMIDSYLSTRAFGMTTQEVAEDMATLTAEIASFTRMSQQSQLDLTNLTVMMTKLGVDSRDMAVGLDLNISALGMLPAEARKAQREITTLALDLGIAPQQMGKEYAQLGPRLAAWGKDTTKVFKEVTAASKALSIASSDLLDIVGEFDTFESAAEHVGSLNAVLGGAYFDTMEMVNATEEERVRLLIQGVQATGQSFGSLGRYQQKAIAAAAGITDMAEANKLFGQSLDVYDELQRATDAGALSYGELSDKALANMSVQEKWAATLESLAISMRPLVDIALALATGLQKISLAIAPGSSPSAMRPVSTFADGGHIMGKPHSAGGVPIMAEGGEFVMRKSAVQAIGSSNLQKMNDTGQMAAAPTGPRTIVLNIDGRKLAKMILDNDEYGLESRLTLRDSTPS